MEMKGVSVMSLQKFAQKKLKPEQYPVWLDSLTPYARTIYTGTILPSFWYDIKKTIIEPGLKLGELLGVSDHKKFAWEIGRHSAEDSLQGIYKLFIQIGSPNFIISQASRILPTYYRPSKAEVVDKGKDYVTLHITEFPEMEEAIEARICGWMERALEICGCKGIKIDITKSLTRGDSLSEYKMSWQS